MKFIILRLDSVNKPSPTSEGVTEIRINSQPRKGINLTTWHMQARRAPRVATSHDVTKEMIRAHLTLVHIFHMYASADTPWVAHALSWCTPIMTETHEGLNPDLSVEMEDNLIGKESRHSRPDYNRLETLRLSNRYTNSRGWHDLVEHDNPALRAPVHQAIEELARASRTSTELQDECEILLAETQWGQGSGNRR
jgi:hypothetical protein